MHLYYFADETNNSKFEEESDDGQEVKAEIVEDVKWFMVTDEDENVEEDIWEDITSPKIHKCIFRFIQGEEEEDLLP